MDFTAHLVRLLNSTLIAIFLFSSCKFTNEKNVENLPFLNVEFACFVNKGNKIYKGGIPFSGRFFKINPKSNDTLIVGGFLNGVKHGKWKTLYLNGQLREVRYFDCGVKVSSLKQWWLNGNKKLVCNFLNGEYDGELKMWDYNGQLIKQMHYKNGYEFGSQKMFYKDGKIRSNYVVKNGRRIGLLGRKNCVNKLSQNEISN